MRARTDHRPGRPARRPGLGVPSSSELGRRMRVALRTRRDRGATAIELAIAGPVLVIFIFFCIQAGFWYYGRTIAVHSAREGLAQMRLFQDEQSYEAGRGPVLEHTRSFASSLGGESLITPEVTSEYDDEDGVVTVRVTGDVITLVPGLHLTASGEASGQIERFEID